MIRLTLRGIATTAAYPVNNPAIRASPDGEYLACDCLSVPQIAFAAAGYGNTRGVNDFAVASGGADAVQRFRARDFKEHVNPMAEG